jgi:RNA polymerase sigma factor (sigma-70 family)
MTDREGASPNQPELNEKVFREELLGTLPHLRAFARGLCGNADYADDLVQETAAKAIAAMDRFTPGTSIRAWTFAILRNLYLTELRRKRRQASYASEDTGDMLVIDAHQEAPLHLADLQAALQRLSEERRTALLLVTGGGFSYQEAAEICDCAVGTIKSRVARARSELLQMLDPEEAADAEAKALAAAGL